MEDYPELVDYLLALLEWLYVVNGGDPSDLDDLALGKVAMRVEANYLGGLTNLQSPQVVEELRSAAASLTHEALSWKESPIERLRLLNAAAAVNLALMPVGSSQ